MFPRFTLKMGLLIYCESEAPVHFLKTVEGNIKHLSILREQAMWFKNIQLFHIEEELKFTATELNELLLQSKLNACSQLEKFSYGWSNPFGNDEEEYFVHVFKNCFLIAFGKNERLLPQSVVSEGVAEKIKKIKQEQNRDVFSRERANIRDEVTFELLPKAFTKKSKLYAYIDTKNKWLIIDTTSPKKTEELINCLRDTLGSLKLSPISLTEKPHVLMSNWLLDHRCPSPFNIEDSCELFDVKNGVGAIKCIQQDLSTTEISNHIRAGKQVTCLALSWADKIAFIINDNFSIKRIQTLDMIEERLKDELVETDYEKQAADFAMMSSEFSLMMEQLFRVFGIKKEIAAAEVAESM